MTHTLNRCSQCIDKHVRSRRSDVGDKPSSSELHHIIVGIELRQSRHINRTTLFGKHLSEPQRLELQAWLPEPPQRPCASASALRGDRPRALLCYLRKKQAWACVTSSAPQETSLVSPRSPHSASPAKAHRGDTSPSDQMAAAKSTSSKMYVHANPRHRCAARRMLHRLQILRWLRSH